MQYKNAFRIVLSDQRAVGNMLETNNLSREGAD